MATITDVCACVCVGWGGGGGGGGLKELLRIFIFRGARDSCIYMLVKSMVYCACVRIPLNYTCGSIFFLICHLIM